MVYQWLRMRELQCYVSTRTSSRSKLQALQAQPHRRPHYRDSVHLSMYIGKSAERADNHTANRLH